VVANLHNLVSNLNRLKSGSFLADKSKTSEKILEKPKGPQSVGHQSGLRGAPDALPPHPGGSDVAEGTVRDRLAEMCINLIIDGTGEQEGDRIELVRADQ
jgi:hypothetical protein